MHQARRISTSPPLNAATRGLHYAGPAVTGDVAEQARVPVDAPAAGFGPEAGDYRHRGERERPVAVAQRHVDPGVRSDAMSMLSGADDPVEAGVKGIAHQADG